MSEEQKSAAQDQPAATSSSSASGSPSLAVLTLKQQAVYDMKVAGKKRSEIAHILGISQPVVSKTLQACYKKLGLKKRDRPNISTGAEHRDPVVVAAAIDAAADPTAESYKAAIERANAMLKAAGINERVSEAMVRRMRVRYASGVAAVRDLRTNDIVDILNKRIDLAAFYLDDKVMAEASARDLMLGLGVLIEKRNLLRGEPTAIISDHERKKLHELMPALIEEARRRGAVTVDGATGEVLEPR